MPTTEEILQNAYDRYLAWESDVQVIQDSYIQSNDGYAQALPIVSETPADGNTKAPDQTTSKPTDQAESWEDLATDLPSEVMNRIQIDVYDGPNGKGYVAVLRYIVSGTLYRKDINYGPESYRDEDWQEVI